MLFKPVPKEPVPVVVGLEPDPLWSVSKPFGRGTEKRRKSNERKCIPYPADVPVGPGTDALPEPEPEPEPAPDPDPDPDEPPPDEPSPPPAIVVALH